jgi:hypothetical protein
MPRVPGYRALQPPDGFQEPAMSLTNPARFLLLAGLPLALAGCVVERPVAYRPPARVAVEAAVVIEEPPPPLPLYDLPPCPYDGYHWMPGFWAWGAAGYYWVPGTWVMPPRVGVLWTPGYWSFVAGGRYAFHEGYWGARVGFYDGINYGGGYAGTGFVGGRWEGSSYHATVINNVTVNNITRVSYSGGQGGARGEPTDEERAAERVPHFTPTALQMQHQQAAGANPELSARHNQGRPPVAATARPGAFRGPQVVAARAEEPRAEPPRREAPSAAVQRSEPPLQPQPNQRAAPASRAQAPKAVPKAAPKPRPRHRDKNDKADDRDRP